MTRYDHALLIKVDDSERQALQQDPRFFYPAYLGPYGWLGLDFDAAKVDWDEVAELVDASFRLQASGAAGSPARRLDRFGILGDGVGGPLAQVDRDAGPLRRSRRPARRPG